MAGQTGESDSRNCDHPAGHREPDGTPRKRLGQPAQMKQEVPGEADRVDVKIREGVPELPIRRLDLVRAVEARLVEVERDGDSDLRDHSDRPDCEIGPPVPEEDYACRQGGAQGETADGGDQERADVPGDSGYPRPPDSSEP